jgi:phosphohistidine phosphatase SixA
MSMWVVRHACAGVKDEWPGPDETRPLDAAGEHQAAALAAVLAAFAPRRLLSSPTTRCMDTLQPLAEALQVAVEPTPLLLPGAKVRLVPVIDELSAGPPTVLCTHGELMEPALGQLRARGLEVGDDLDDEALLLKGAAWQLDRRDGAWRLELVAPVPIASCPSHPG